MWSKSRSGSWVPRNSIQRMSDSADEYREVSEGSLLQLGDSVVAYTYPLTEGLIIDRNISDEGKIDLTLLIAPHKKKGKKWSPTKVSVRDASRMSKKAPRKFTFPIKGVESLRAEVRKAKADPSWIGLTSAKLDREFRKDNCSSSEDSDELEEKEQGEIREETEAKLIKRNDNLETRIKEVLQLQELGLEKRTRKTRSKKEDEESDFESWRKWRKEMKSKRKRKSRKSAKKEAVSSSSSSSSSSSEDSPRNGEVGEKASTGLFSCPFSVADSRGFRDVKAKIQGQSLTRKNVRTVLHNLYAEHHTLSSFANDIIHQANSNGYKPYASDTAWFRAYAADIDTILLNSLAGPWSAWNEPVIDRMTTGFLELLIRVAPHKEYPACFDDSVRKWMKKKRIGTNTRYGPVSYAMQHAKFTEGGVVLYQAGGQRPREKTFQKTSQNGNFQKQFTPPSQGGDKRPSPTA